MLTLILITAQLVFAAPNSPKYSYTAIKATRTEIDSWEWPQPKCKLLDSAHYKKLNKKCKALPPYKKGIETCEHKETIELTHAFTRKTKRFKTTLRVFPNLKSCEIHRDSYFND